MNRWLRLAAIVLCLATFVRLASGQAPATVVAYEQLLKNPESYHGKLVQVTGFLVDEFENHALYENKAWQRNRGMWITPDHEMLAQRQNLKNHYVKLSGMFNAHQHGHLGQFGGTLTVTKFALTEEPKDK